MQNEEYDNREHTPDSDTTYSSGIHGVSKQLEPGPLTTKHTSSDWTRMEANTQPKVLCVRSQLHHHLLHHVSHLVQDVPGKPGHGHCMVLPGLRQTRDSHIAITHSLHLEDSATLGNLIKGGIDILQKGEHLSRLTGGRPGSKSHKAVAKKDQVRSLQLSLIPMVHIHRISIDLLGKNNGCLWKQIGDRFRLETSWTIFGHYLVGAVRQKVF